MKKSLGRALADLSLEDEDNCWDEEEVYEGSNGCEPEAEEPRPDVDGEKAGDDQNELGEVCAICLNAIEPIDLAIVKGCEHEYCVNCILQWALCKEAPWCPQCKKPFNYLYCHRLLDGELSDAPVEESVCLLKRASWFVEHVKTLEKGKAVSAAMAADEWEPPEWAEGYQYYDDEDAYDDDEQIENYYFSGAARHARVVLGNRRLGENGYMRAGRMYARPTNNNHNSQFAGSSGGIGKAGKGRNEGSKAGPAGSSSSSVAGGSGGAGGSSGAGGSGGDPSGSGSAQTPGVKGQGRRAKRNARRAAADLEEI